MSDKVKTRRLLFITTVVASSDGFLEETARIASTRGFEVDLMTNISTSKPRNRPYSRIHETTWGRGFKSPSGTLKSLVQIRGLLNNGNYTIVHTHTPTASAITRIAAATIRRTQRPVIVYTSHGFHFGEGLNGLSHQVAEVVERQLLRWTDLLMVINDEDESWARRNAPAQTRVMRTNGVGISERFFEFKRTPESRKSAREQLQIEADAFVVLSIGELNANKRKELAMSAVAGLHGNRLLLIVGEGDMREPLLKRANDMSSLDPDLEIRLCGYQNDIAPFLLAADCLLHTSAREGHPLVILEAMAAGLPAVSVPIRGCVDSLRDGRGLLAEGSDPLALTRELQVISKGGSTMDQVVNLAGMYANKFHRSALSRELVVVYKNLSQGAGKDTRI